MATKRKRRKPRWIIMRFRKNDPTHNLLAATQRYVHANGGALVLIGGIGIMNRSDPFGITGPPSGKFAVVVDCLGDPPKKEEPAAEKEKPKKWPWPIPPKRRRAE